MSTGANYLVLTNKTDLTADYIVREMRKRGLDFARINTEDISDYTITQTSTSDSILSNSHNSINFRELKSAYFRRPSIPDVKGFDSQSSNGVYIREEWSYLLRSLYLEIGDRWFNHPNFISLAEDKPKQLRVAKKLGFNVPETVITNDMNSVISLFDSGEVVGKPLRHALLEESGISSRVIFTSKIASLTDINRDALRLAPVIFQRKIKKQYDLRVTVVENKVFPTAIHSQDHEQTETDWRHNSIEKLRHSVAVLPDSVTAMCRKMVAQFGLRFGAIDLVLDPSGDYWFLECNPNGQWAWIESVTGVPISEAIVDSMVGFRK